MGTQVVVMVALFGTHESYAHLGASAVPGKCTIVHPTPQLDGSKSEPLPHWLAVNVPGLNEVQNMQKNRHSWENTGMT